MAWKRILRMAALLAAALLTGLFLASVGTNPLSGRRMLPVWAWPAILIGTGAMLAAVLAVHEAGHWIGGRLAGFRFLVYIVGPLRIERRGEGIEVGWNRSLALSGGLRVMTPVDDVDLPRRVSRMVAGGPAASLMLTLLASLLGMALLGHPFAAVMPVLSVLSALIFVATVLPIKTGHFYTDGARLMMLRHGGPEAERWCAMMALLGVAMGPVRPREWNPGLVQAMLRHLDESYDGLGALMMAFQWSLDRGKIEEARHWLDQALAKRALWPKPFRASILLEAAYFHSLYGGERQKLRNWLEEARGGVMIEPYTRFRAEAAVAMAEGRNEEAQLLIQEARHVLARESETGLIIAERACLDQLDEALLTSRESPL